MKAKESITNINKFITKLHGTVLKNNPLFKNNNGSHAPKSAKQLIDKYNEDIKFRNWVNDMQSKAISMAIEKEKARIFKYANKFIKKIFVALDRTPHGGGGILRMAGYFQKDEWYFTTFYDWINMYNVSYIEKEDSDFALSQVIDVIYKERDKRLNLLKELS